MNMRVKVMQNGEVSIPKDVRERLSWTPGTALEIVETSEGLSLRRISAARTFPRTKLSDLKAFPAASPARPIAEISRLSDDDIRRLLP